MTQTEAILWGVGGLASLAGSALCSGMEMGVYRVSRVRLRLRAAGGNGAYAARLLQGELERPERVLGTLLIANNAFNYLAALSLTALLTGAGLSDAAIIGVNALVLTPMLLVVAESLPKEIFRTGADRLTLALATHLAVARILLTWAGILPLLHAFAEAVSRLIGGEGGAGLARTSRERLEALLKESAGMLSEPQAGLVDRALAFRRMTVGDEMVPWSRVETVRSDWSRSRLLATISRQRHAHYPVVDAQGRVVGVLRSTEAYLRPEARPPDLAEEVARLSPSVPLGEAILRVRQAAVPVGIVEAAGRPVGMVTIKDLVEPLTGELTDW